MDLFTVLLAKALTGDATGVDSKIDEKVAEAVEEIEDYIAPREESFIATSNYTIGTLLFIEDGLYRVINVNINNGDILSPGINIEATTISDHMLSGLSSIAVLG